jgi:hypothetical protein
LAATARAWSGFASTTPTSSTSGKFGQNAGVVLSQVPDADYRCPQARHVQSSRMSECRNRRLGASSGG